MSERKIIAAAIHKYKQLNRESSLYKQIFYNYLREFAERGGAFMPFLIFLISDGEIFNQDGTEFLFHGPNFEENKCKFDCDIDSCTGHQNNIICLTNNLLYTFRHQEKRTRDNRIGYVILCKVVMGNVKSRDPEDTQPIDKYFEQGYDTVVDYGNKKCFKVISKVLPYCLIGYRRNYNSRLDNPANQIFEAENINPAPEVTYETLDHNTIEQLGLNCLGNILSVRKIINPYLERKYNEVKEKYYPNARDWNVFHGTTFECVDLIAKYNLDWRKSTSGKYGWGVHFASYPKYAAYFPMKRYDKALSFDGPKKCLIMFKMLYDEDKLYYVSQNDIAQKLSGMEQSPKGYNGVHVEYSKYVIHKRLEDVLTSEIPEKVDVIVSEWMGFYLLHEAMLDSIILARERFLKPNGLLFPEYATIYATPCSIPSMYNEWEDVSGVKMASFAKLLREQAGKKPLTETIPSECVLAEPEVVSWIDLREVTSEDLNKITFQHVAVSNKVGTYDGICLWFSCTFPCPKGINNLEPITLSTAPDEPSTHWKQTLIVLPSSMSVEVGSPIAYELVMTRSTDNTRRYVLEVTMLDPEEVEHPEFCSCYMTKCILLKAMMEKYNQGEGDNTS